MLDAIKNKSSSLAQSKQWTFPVAVFVSHFSSSSIEYINGNGAIIIIGIPLVFIDRSTHSE